MIAFSRQNLTSIDVRFWRLKSIPAFKVLIHRGTLDGFKYNYSILLKRISSELARNSGKYNLLVNFIYLQYPGSLVIQTGSSWTRLECPRCHYSHLDAWLGQITSMSWRLCPVRSRDGWGKSSGWRDCVRRRDLSFISFHCLFHRRTKLTGYLATSRHIEPMLD